MIFLDLRIESENPPRQRRELLPLAGSLFGDAVIRGAAAAVLISSVALACVDQRLEERTIRLRDASLPVRAAADSLAEARLRSRELDEERSRLQGLVDAIAGLERGRYAWGRLMDASAAAVPEYAWLEGIEMDSAPGSGAVSIRIFGFAPSLESVTRFEKALLARIPVERLELASSDGVEIGGYPLLRFSLTGEMSPQRAPQGGE